VIHHHVWVVNCFEEVDGIYCFEDEDQARVFAERHYPVSVTEEVVLNPTTGAQFLIDTEDAEAP